MRVLIIFNHPAPYKVRVFNELAKYVDLTVIFERNKAKDRPDSFYADNQINFKHIILEKGYIGNEGSTTSEVRNYIRKHHNEFDVILMNGYSHLAEIKAIKYLSKHHIKFGLLINGGVVHKGECYFKKAYKTSLIKKADYYLSPSKMSNEYLKYYGANPNNIFNYYYSNYSNSDISSATFEEKVKYRQKYNLPLAKKIFINPSQFIDRKNNLFLISLFENRDDILLLVGEGEEKVKYEEYIKDHNMNNVIILPFKEKAELNELYKASDVHITLSKEDIFGHTILESFSNGVPVISSKAVISALEYVKDGNNGFLVDISDKSQIIRAMDSINSSFNKNALESARLTTFENSASSIYEILNHYE